MENTRWKNATGALRKMSKLEIKKNISRYDFSSIVCSKCKVNGCKYTTFCYKMYRESLESFTSVFEYINSNIDSFNTLSTEKKLKVFCTKCVLKNECFIDDASTVCLRSLEIQLDKNSATKFFGFSTKTHSHKKNVPKFMFSGDISLKLFFQGE